MNDGIYIRVMVAMRDRLHELSGSQAKVLLCIALHWDGETSWPSLACMQRETGLYRDTIMEVIKSLEAGGWIAVCRVNGKANTYRIATDLIQMGGQTSMEKPYRFTPTSSKKPAEPVGKNPTATSREKPYPKNKPVEEESKEEDTQPPPAPVTGVDWAKAHIDCMNPWYEKAQNYRRKLKSHTGSATVWLATKLRETYGDIYTPEQVDAQIDKRASEGWTGTYYELFADSSNGNGSRRRGGFDQAEESRKAMAMLEAMEER